jgi:two-component system cell cycle response regulator
VSNETAGTLYLIVPADADQTAARHTLAQLAHMFGKVATLSDRHNRLQKLAITDELTGVYNARYFRHFLARILDKAKKLHFPVTLLLFDIDDFKKYNDQFGHGVGDEILKQTAAMMKRATREHDLVARIGGDEFAVVFWDKEGPRQPREPRPGAVSRPPQTPLQIFDRFKRMIASDEFTALGKSGKGVLGISAGLAVYPYEASDAATLIQEADRALMQGAKKRTGKNTIFIVGSDNLQKPQGGV